MRIPFPLALNIGTDIISIHRLLRTRGSATVGSDIFKLAKRFLHPLEITELDKRFRGWQNVQEADLRQQRKISEWLAGRWAAKEAAKKAWGASLISFKDLRTEVLKGGEVAIICQSYNETNHLLERPSKSVEQMAKLSISHDGDYAVATVIASPLDARIKAELQLRKDAAALKVNRPRQNVEADKT